MRLLKRAALLIVGGLLVGACVIVLLGGLLGILLTRGGTGSDSASAPISGNWAFIVPVGYRGTLAIEFDCPNGHAFVRSGVIRTQFSTHGVDCVRDSVSSWVGQYNSVTRSDGTPLATDLDGLPASRDVFIDYQGTEVIGGGSVENPGKDITFDSYYVGPARCALELEASMRGLRSSVPPTCNQQSPESFIEQAIAHHWLANS